MKTTIATILVLFAAALHALAAETTFAIVDLNAVFIGYSKTKSAEAEIVRLRSQAKNELARLEKTGDAAAVSEFRKTSEAKLQKDFVSLRDPIIKEIVAAVSAVQVEQKIDFVFDSNAKSVSGVPTMFALSGTARDITGLVANKLNSGANFPIALQSSPAKAKVGPVEIRSDGPSDYNKENGIATASDNVIITVDGIVLKADHVEYDANKREVKLFALTSGEATPKLIAKVIVE